MVCGAELGDDHVDLITFSWISVSLIQSRGGLPSHISKVRSLTPRCQSQKFCFAFALSFLCPFSWPLGGHVRGGSLVKPVRGGADWHGARSTGIDRLDVASGGRQHSLSFILWSILTTHTHTHNFISAQLV